ncbi:hypothetical protein C8N25_1266 [Algoriphagus antarcticus]|uniref:Uncharacterized protein n=1 Tax=Algoriphagus antarcticus TaxID=238540 RepID=A0A3E0DFN1_9BACT|nr:hypothetical protein C8N25_1266 [Algoriphagus antarcticus]
MVNSISHRLSSLSHTWSRTWVNSYILLLILSGVTVFAFLPTLSNDFQLAWDDTWQVLENPLVNSTSLQVVFYHLTHFWQQQFSPVNSLFYLVIFQLFGMNASAFHTACLLIHCCNTALVFLIAKKLLPTLLPRVVDATVRSYAFFTALIFCHTSGAVRVSSLDQRIENSALRIFHVDSPLLLHSLHTICTLRLVSHHCCSFPVGFWIQRTGYHSSIELNSVRLCIWKVHRADLEAYAYLQSSA